MILPMMDVALTCDHRVVDGREAVPFLAKVKEFTEAPGALLLEAQSAWPSSEPSKRNPRLREGNRGRRKSVRRKASAILGRGLGEGKVGASPRRPGAASSAQG